MTSMGNSEFVLTIFGALAQEESANTSKRVKFGKKMNAEKGRVPNIVYGYDKTIGDYFNLAINKEESKVVQQIYKWYTEEGYGAAKIANMLNEKGYKTKRNCKWSQNATCRILTNEIYTGIIIGKTDTELLIVTNNHVVAGSDTLTVAFTDESTVEANIKGTDAQYDVAVIAVPIENISDDTLDAISVATLGDSTSLKVGEPAIAIGNALGYGQSVTTGVISALNRSVSMTNEETGDTQESGVKLIQTDAAINEGNSGGALVNVNGEVIGINSSKLVGDSVEGIGYAIPISDVGDLIENLMNRETKTKVAEDKRGLIGITGKNLHVRGMS